MKTCLELVCGITIAAVFVGCGPKDGNKEFELGKSAYELRDLKKAEKMFSASVQAAPEDVDRLLFLARVKLDLGELAAAKQLVDRAATQAAEDSDVRLLGAQIAWHSKDYAASAAMFSKVADDSRFSSDIRAQGWAGLGIVEMTCNNIHLARIAFLRAIRLDRRCASAWYHLGCLYRDGFGYLDSALEQFEIFVRLEEMANPRVQEVQRSVIPALKDSIAHAITERPGVSKRDSAAASTAIAKAEAASKKGNFKLARQSYQEAIKLDPLSYPAALGLAKAWEKSDASKSGQEKAFENYKLACSLRPSAISTFLAAGSFAAKLGYHAQAVEIYSRAVAASPSSYEALDGLIRALRKVGNRTKIAQAYQNYRDSVVRSRKK